MIPTLLTATSVFIIAFIAAPPVDIDRQRRKTKKENPKESNIYYFAPKILFLIIYTPKKSRAFVKPPCVEEL
jgi:hypothetical protein